MTETLFISLHNHVILNKVIIGLTKQRLEYDAHH